MRSPLQIKMPRLLYSALALLFFTPSGIESYPQRHRYNSLSENVTLQLPRCFFPDSICVLRRV
jgi:hypothetical protein